MSLRKSLSEWLSKKVLYGTYTILFKTNMSGIKCSSKVAKTCSKALSEDYY